MANIKRREPDISVDDFGKVIWTPVTVNYDPLQWYRGKTVSSEDFNNLFIQQVIQGNYNSDSLAELFATHLNTAVSRTFKTDFQLKQSFTKLFTADDWGEVDENGYYYITITKSEHGFEPLEEASLDGFNIDLVLYILKDGRFYQVHQANISADNLVTIYTDDNTISGFIVIRSNDRSYNLSGSYIHVDSIINIAQVARTNLYTDLNDRPDAKIDANTARLDAIYNIEDPTPVLVAEYAKTLDSNSKISNIKVSDIFEPGSNYVKNATVADGYTPDGNIAQQFNALTARINVNSTDDTIRYNELKQTISNNYNTLNTNITNNYNTLSTNISRIISGPTKVNAAVTADVANSTSAPVLIYDGQNQTVTADSTVKLTKSITNFKYLLFAAYYISGAKKEYVTQIIPVSLFNNSWEYEYVHLSIRAFSTSTARYITVCRSTDTSVYVSEVSNLKLTAIYGIK